MALIIPTSSTPVTITPGAVNQNTTGWDIVVCVIGVSRTWSTDFFAYSDSSNPPTTQVGRVTSWPPPPFTDTDTTLCFPVKNNDYWKVTGSTTATAWIWQLETTTGVVDSGDLANSLNTVYRNLTSSVQMVVVQLSSVSNISNAYHDSFNPPTNPVWQQGVLSAGGTQTVVLMVPGGDYYKVTCTGATVAHWHAYTLPLTATRSANLSASRTSPTSYQNTNADAIWISALLASTGVGGSTILKLATTSPATQPESEFSDPGGTLLPIYGFAAHNYYYGAFRDAGAAGATNDWWEYTFTGTGVNPKQILQFANP